MKMVSDDENAGKGFVANWITVCGENIYNELIGTVQSVDFGKSYQKNLNCIWNITARL